MRQRFESMSKGLPIVCGVNTRLRVDQPVAAWWHAPDDLARVTGDVDRYKVFSQPPEPTSE